MEKWSEPSDPAGISSRQPPQKPQEQPKKERWTEVKPTKSVAIYTLGVLLVWELDFIGTKNCTMIRNSWMYYQLRTTWKSTRILTCTTRATATPHTNRTVQNLETISETFDVIFFAGAWNGLPESWRFKVMFQGKLHRTIFFQQFWS